MKLMDSDGDLFTVDEQILWSYTVQFLGKGKLGSRLERPHWIPPHHWARLGQGLNLRLCRALVHFVILEC